MLAGTEAKFDDITLQLLAAKAVYWPRQQTLFVADLHFGKGTVLRRSGVPVPSGSTAETLDRLWRLVQACSARRLIVLGDLFHARGALSQAVCEQFERFLESLGQIGLGQTAFGLVIGNHDRSTGRLPSHWPVELIAPGTVWEGLTLCHEPREPGLGSRLALCGHIHPSVQVGNRRETLGRQPCFWLSQRCLVLPAFGSFTGTHTVKVRPRDQVWAILEESVMPLGRSHRATSQQQEVRLGSNDGTVVE